MIRFTRRHPRTSAVIIAASFFLPVSYSNAQKQVVGGDRQWNSVGGTLANTHFSTLTQINAKTIVRLGGAWRVPLDSSVATKATPVVRGGVMFLTAGRSVYALDAKTGQRIWTYEPESTFPNDKGVALGEG